MIAGPSSSGKTTFSNRLSIQLLAKGRKPHPISLDDYYDDRERCPRDADGNLDFECLEALDVRQFNEDMTRLLAGEKVDMPSFNFKTGKREYRGRTLQLKENDILVIEGIHGLNDKLSYTLPAESKFKIYISALTQLNIDEHNPLSTTDCRLLRRIVRDARTRGTTAQETIAMWKSVRRGEEKIFSRFRTVRMLCLIPLYCMRLRCLKYMRNRFCFRFRVTVQNIWKRSVCLSFWTIFCRFRRKELHRVLWCGNLSEEVVLMYKNTVNFTA